MAVLLLTSGTSVVFAQTGSSTPESGTSTNVTAPSGADTTEPSDVENLKALPGDSEVLLTWDSSTDNVSVVGYKIYRGTRSVKTSTDLYDLPTIPVGNVKSYTVKNLQNDRAYYFSMTAVDAAGNESANYATEVSATPKTGLTLPDFADDGASPTVVEVKSEDPISVTIEFSEPVKLPEERPESAFQITKAPDNTRLAVQRAELDVRDETGKTVLLTTAPQTGDAEYTVTVGVEVEDFFANPIVGGLSDKGMFKGSAPKQSVGTSTQANPSTGSGQASTQMHGSAMPDTTPPEDVTKFFARVKDVKKSIIELRWTASKNKDNDLANQLMYKSDGRVGKEYGSFTALGATATSTIVQDLEGGKWYTFKISTKDTTGNESKGAVSSVYLPKTGPGMVAAGITALFMGWYRRKKK